MRVIAEIPHTHYKITMYWWNAKYIVKFETPFAEQTYKFSEFDVTSESAIKEWVSHPDFEAQILRRFEEMQWEIEELRDGL